MTLDDKASDAETKDREYCLVRARQHALVLLTELEPMGICYGCTNTIEPGDLFCSSDCADGYVNTRHYKHIYTGFCHSCGDAVSSPKLYCNGQCASTHFNHISMIPRRH